VNTCRQQAKSALPLDRLKHCNVTLHYEQCCGITGPSATSPDLHVFILLPMCEQLMTKPKKQDLQDVYVKDGKIKRLKNDAERAALCTLMSNVSCKEKGLVSHSQIYII